MQKSTLTLCTINCIVRFIEYVKKKRSKVIEVTPAAEYFMETAIHFFRIYLMNRKFRKTALYYHKQTIYKYSDYYK